MLRNKILSEFFEREYDTLVKRVSKRAGSPENAEDVVQEAFYRALKYWDSYSPDNALLGAWFNTILNNACKDKVSDDRKLGMCIEFDEELFDGVEMSHVGEDLAKHISKLISTKEFPRREVLRLYYEKGYKPSEICQILDVENSAARQAIWRFKDEVRGGL